MKPEETAILNHLVLKKILENVGAQNLLPWRLVSKSWRCEINRILIKRQRQFFLSPDSKTESRADLTDSQWRKGWAQVLQISFIFSHKRQKFIRASHRLIHASHPLVHLEASEGHEGHENQAENALFEELDDYWKGTVSRTTKSSVMAGCTLQDLTDFLSKIQRDRRRSENGDELGISGFPCTSFRFELGYLDGSEEITNFFSVMSPQILHLTVNMHHFCSKPSGRQLWWDLTFGQFRRLHELRVLTILIQTFWVQEVQSLTQCYDELGIRSLDLNHLTEAEKIHKFALKNDGKPFSQLQCLRIVRGCDYVSSHTPEFLSFFESFKVPKIVCEYGTNLICLSPRFLDLSKMDKMLGVVVAPTRQRSPLSIPAITLRLFKSSTPEFLDKLAEILKTRSRGESSVKRLCVIVNSGCDANVQPYNSCLVRPLLKILGEISGSIETLTLLGGAAVLFEGLLHLVRRDGECYPLTFPKVRRLNLSSWQTFGTNLQKTDFNFQLSPFDFSHVFPGIEELSLEWDFMATDFSWIPFVSGRDDICKGAKAERNTVKKLWLDNNVPPRILNRHIFKGLESLCLGCSEFRVIAANIWTLECLQTLILGNMYVNGKSETLKDSVFPQVESSLTGLSKELIVGFAQELERICEIRPGEERKKMLGEKRKVFKELVMKGRSILSLSHLRHLKFWVTIVQRTFSTQELLSLKIFSAVSGLLLVDLLPVSSHVTIWGSASYSEIPMERQMDLQTRIALCSSVYINK